MDKGSMPSVRGAIRVTDELIQGFYKVLEDNNISLEDAINDLEQASERIKKQRMKNTQKKLKSDTINEPVITHDKLYKFKTHDGWLQFDGVVYRKMQEYFNTEEYPSIPDFFGRTGIRPERVSRIINDENRATIFNEQIAIDIYTFDEYFVLSNYDSYKMIDQNGEENPYLDF